MSYFSDWMSIRGLDEHDIEDLIQGNVSYNTEEPFYGEEVFLETLHTHFLKRSVVTICPDYDADGIMAGVLCYASLCELGFENVHCYYPSQTTGYGLSESSAREILNFFPDTQLVITCDNGIHSDAAVSFFEDHDISVLITDHHPSASRPSADGCIDPAAIDETYAFDGISGATVTWKIMCRYAQRYSLEKYSNVYALSVFAGISAVADSMPMLEENRKLVRSACVTIRALWNKSQEGLYFPSDMLDGFSDESIRAFFGLYSLLKVISENGGRLNEADETFFGFTLSPILNSARRVELKSEAAFNVFIENDECTAYESASYLHYLNQTRKGIVGPLSDQAVIYAGEEASVGVYSLLTPVTTIFCFGADGCLGLIANNLTAYTGYPSVCFSLSESNYRDISDEPFIERNDRVLSGFMCDFVSGSARAPGWFDFYSFFEWFNNLYPGAAEFGGHSQAGAFSVSVKYLAEFSSSLLSFASNVFKTLPESDVIAPYDMSICFSGDADADIILYEDSLDDMMDFSVSLDKLKPYGVGFLKPCFRLFVDISSYDISVRYMSGGKHIKFSSKGCDLIIWNVGEQFSMERPSSIYVDASLGINEFRGNKTITFYANSYSSVFVNSDNVFDANTNVMIF